MKLYELQICDGVVFTKPEKIGWYSSRKKANESRAIHIKLFEECEYREGKKEFYKIVQFEIKVDNIPVGWMTMDPLGVIGDPYSDF